MGQNVCGCNQETLLQEPSVRPQADCELAMVLAQSFIGEDGQEIPLQQCRLSVYQMGQCLPYSCQIEVHKRSQSDPDSFIFIIYLEYFKHEQLYRD